MSLPTGTVYGSQVMQSGDMCVKTMAARNRYTVSTESITNHRTYVTDASDSSVTQASTVINEVSGGAGFVSFGALDSVSGEMVKTFKTNPTSTTIISDSKRATLSGGLSFDSDDCAIYFGENKIFRIMFSDDSPARLIFQCLNETTSDYVTKFSCTQDV